MCCGLVAMIARPDKTSRLLDETGAEPAIVLNALTDGSDVASSCTLRMQPYYRNRHGGIIPLVNNLHLWLRSMTWPTCGSCCAPSFHRVFIARPNESEFALLVPRNRVMNVVNTETR
jgi:hypothetical protein